MPNDGGSREQAADREGRPRALSILERLTPPWLTKRWWIDKHRKRSGDAFQRAPPSERSAGALSSSGALTERIDRTQSLRDLIESSKIQPREQTPEVARSQSVVKLSPLPIPGHVPSGTLTDKAESPPMLRNENDVDGHSEFSRVVSSGSSTFSRCRSVDGDTSRVARLKKKPSSSTVGTAENGDFARVSSTASSNSESLKSKKIKVKRERKRSHKDKDDRKDLPEAPEVEEEALATRIPSNELNARSGRGKMSRSQSVQRLASSASDKRSVATEGKLPRSKSFLSVATEGKLPRSKSFLSTPSSASGGLAIDGKLPQNDEFQRMPSNASSGRSVPSSLRSIFSRVASAPSAGPSNSGDTQNAESAQSPLLRDRDLLRPKDPSKKPAGWGILRSLMGSGVDELPDSYKLERLQRRINMRVTSFKFEYGCNPTMQDVRENANWEAERLGSVRLTSSPAECLRLQLKIAKEGEDNQT